MSISLILDNTRDLANCEYQLTIDGENLWSLQYFFYDHIKRRTAFQHLSKNVFPEVHISKGLLGWKATLNSEMKNQS